MKRLKKALKQGCLFSLLLFCASVHSTCPELRSFQVRAGESVVIEITQAQSDLITTAYEGNALKKYNNALGRTGVEFLLLDTADKERNVQLCFSVVQSPETVHFQPAIRLLSNLTETELSIYRRLSEASAMWAKNDTDSRKQAIDAWKVASQESSRADLIELHFYSELNRAAASMDLFDYDQALLATGVIVDHPARSFPFEYKASWIRARVLTRQGHASQAIPLLESALEKIQLNREMHLDIADMQNLLAIAYLQINELTRAEELLNSALEYGGDDLPLEASILDNFGYLYVQKAKLVGDPQRSIDFYKAIEFELIASGKLKLLGNDAKRATVESNIGTIYDRLGEVRRAQRHYQKALALIDNIISPERKAILYKNLGKISQYLGDYQNALNFQDASVRLFAEGSPTWSARIRCELGATKRRLNDFAGAESDHRVCLNYFEKTELTDDHVKALYELASDLFSQNRIAESKGVLDSGLVILEQVQNVDTKVNVLLLSAQIAHKLNAFSDASTFIATALELSSLARYPSIQIDVLSTATAIAMDSDNIELANNYVDRGIQLALATYQHLEPHLFGPAWSGKTQSLFEAKTKIILANHGSDDDILLHNKIFEVLEQSRALSLRSNQAAEEKRDEEIKQSELNKLSLLADLNAASSTLKSGQLNTELSHQQFLLYQLSEQNIKTDAALSLKTVQQSLREHEAVLYYVYIDQTIFLFLIDRNNSALTKIGQADEVNQSITGWIDDMQNPNSVFVQKTLSLSKTLLPLQNVLSLYNKLLIVPDNDLSLVSFAALSTTHSDKYTPLMVSHVLTYPPSISQYIRSRTSDVSSEAQQALSIAMFTDPVFENTLQQKQTVLWTNSLASLPFSALEKDKISQVLNNVNQLSYSQKSANRLHFFSQPVRDSSIVHIATHGFFNQLNPENVGFALSVEDEHDKPINGFVSKAELNNYQFSSQLIVLSGCETNRGYLINSEGSQGLARTFLRQGAKNVISTQWKISDAVSPILMETFYRNLVAEQDISKALQLTQQALFKRFRYRHPFYWAAYTHQSMASDMINLAPD